jgi:hypothetical protein
VLHDWHRVFINSETSVRALRNVAYFYHRPLAYSHVSPYLGNGSYRAKSTSCLYRLADEVLEILGHQAPVRTFRSKARANEVFRPTGTGLSRSPLCTLTRPT